MTPPFAFLCRVLFRTPLSLRRLSPGLLGRRGIVGSKTRLGRIAKASTTSWNFSPACARPATRGMGYVRIEGQDLLRAV